MLTGGEPLLHPRFKDFLNILWNNNIPAILNTNGWALDLLTHEDLKGIKSIIVSLDTWDPQNYNYIRGRNIHDRIVKSILNISKLSPNTQITISCLIQKKNLLYLKDMYDYSRSICASSLSLLVPSFENYGFGWEKVDKTPQYNAPLNLKEIDVLEKHFSIMKELDNKQNRFLNQNCEILDEYIQYFKMLAGTTYQLQHYDCFVPLSTITVTEQNTLKPCFYLPNEFPINLNNFKSSIEIIHSFRNSFNRQFAQCKTCMQFLCNEWIRPLSEKG